LKAGDSLKDIENVKKIVELAGGIAKAADFNAAGILNYDVAKLCKSGILIKIRHGYYQLANAEPQEDETIIARLFPDGTICMDCALFHYGYSDRTPNMWTLAFPRTIARSRFKLDYPPIEPYFVNSEFLDLGRSTSHFNGIEMSIYDRERTICDCFKYRAKMESEMFSKAINAYAADDKKNLANLAIYAKKLRIWGKVNDLIGVMVNG
jgi:predicted transcriptional regulator of viral defense system